MVRADQSHAVGPDDAHAGRARDVDELVLHSPPCLAELGEPGGHDDSAADFRRGALPHGFAEALRRHRQQRHVNRSGCIRDARVGPVPHDIGPAGVDRQDEAGKAMLREIAHDAAAELGHIVGSTDHGDGARSEDVGDAEARGRRDRSVPARVTLRPILAHRQELTLRGT